MLPLPQLLIALGAIFLAALAFDAVGRRTKLPRVTLLLVFGFVIGPSVLDWLPDLTAAWFPFVANLALVMVGFLLGGSLTRRTLRERGWQVLAVSATAVVSTFAVVWLGLWAVGAPPVVALLLAAIATATDPAASADVVHETRHDTSFSRTLIAIVAVDDVWGLLVFSVAFALGLLLLDGGSAGALAEGAAQSTPDSVLGHAFWELGGALVLGVGLGVPMALLTGRIEPGEPSLYEALGLVLLCGGLAMWLDVSFLLASMVLGVTVANLARHHTRPFHAIEGIEWPFMILFFVLAGATLDVGALSEAGLWLLAYLALRVGGRLVGGYLGGWWPPADRSVRRWMGLALLPQAGVALGMALVAAQRLPEVGEAIIPLVVASTVIFEVVGPVATRFALDRAAGEAEGAEAAG
ncbi:MAG: cation:proton antiporter [Myxococcota bacterium]